MYSKATYNENKFIKIILKYPGVLQVHEQLVKYELKISVFPEIELFRNQIIL